MQLLAQRVIASVLYARRTVCIATSCYTEAASRLAQSPSVACVTRHQMQDNPQVKPGNDRYLRITGLAVLPPPLAAFSPAATAAAPPDARWRDRA